MSKRITTHWYIGAWVVWLLGVAAMFLLSKAAQSTTTPPPGVFLDYIVMFVAAVVMFFMWLGALLRLGTRRAWGWFVAVALLHLVGLGILGMAAYAMAGPRDARGHEPASEIVYRPRAT